MNRSLTTNGPLAPAAVLLSIVMLIVALAGPGLLPASADQFTPLEDPPSILVNTSQIVVGDPQDEDGEVSGSMDPSATSGSPFSAFDGFEPAAPASPGVSGSDTYNIFATITTNGQLENVTRVRLCLYDSVAIDAGDVDGACGIPSGQASSDALPDLPEAADPKDRFVIEWAAGEPDPTVTIVGTNQYTDAGTFFDLDDGTENTGDNTRSATIRFSFKVSEAMQVGDKWKIRAAAESQAEIGDDLQDEQSAIDLPAAELEVKYFQRMVAGRATSVDYGIVFPNVTALKTDDGSISSGEYHANAPSALTISATQFFHGGTAEDPDNVIPLAENGDIWEGNTDRNNGGTLGDAAAIRKNVPNGQVSLDCAFADDVDPDDADDQVKFVQVRNTARILAIGKNATAEGGTSLDDHSCMLNYPGGGPVANVPYSNTVTLGMIQGGSGTIGGTSATD